MILSVSAAVADTMLDWVASNEALSISSNQVESRISLLRLTEAKLKKGLATELDVANAREALERAKSDLDSYREHREIAFHQLELLTGEQPAPALRNKLARYSHLNDVLMPPDVPEGLPSQMIQRRPDIRAAEAALRATNDDIGAARAEFFPKIQITAANGTASNNITKLFQSGMGAWSFAPQVTVPLFDAGRLSAQLREAKEKKRETLAQYEHTIQISFKEVSDALVQREVYRRQYEDRRASLVAALTRYKLSDARAARGYDNYLSVLDNEYIAYGAKLAVISAQLQYQANLITLYKALGGGWNGTIRAPLRSVGTHNLL